MGMNLPRITHPGAKAQRTVTQVLSFGKPVVYLPLNLPELCGVATFKKRSVRLINTSLTGQLAIITHARKRTCLR